MNIRLYISLFLVFTLAAVGCGTAPGKPKPGLEKEAIRPDQVADFATLYSQNCAANACSGARVWITAVFSLLYRFF